MGALSSLLTRSAHAFRPEGKAYFGVATSSPGVGLAYMVIWVKLASHAAMVARVAASALPSAEAAALDAVMATVRIVGLK
jgi:hypothetical protein